MSNQGVSGGTGRIAAIGCTVIGGLLLLIVGGVGFLGIVGAGGAAWFLTARPTTEGIEDRKAADAEAAAVEEAVRAAQDAEPPTDAGQDAAPDPAEPAQPAEPVPSTTTTPSTTAASTTPPSSTTTASTSAETQPKATTPPKSTPAPTTSTSSTTSTPASAPASTPATSAGSRVTMSGDGTVVLIGGTRRYPLPATMQPGTYSIEVTFSGEPPVTTGKVRVKEGEDIVITCKSAMGICRVN